MEKIIFRVIGNNLAGGARKYCHLLNEEIKSRGGETRTFIPRAPIPDKLTDQESTSTFYKNTRNWAYVGLKIALYRRRIEYVHLHLRNVAVIIFPLLAALRIPYVITVHAPNQAINTIKQEILSRLYKKSLRKARLVVFISNYVRNQVMDALGLHAEQLNSVVVYNGSADSSSGTKPEQIDKFRIVVVGELTERKGIRSYPAFFEQLVKHSKPCVIRFFGEGPLRDMLLSEAEKHMNTCVQIEVCGYESDPRQIFENADLHCILSTQEAFGRVVTEAMAFSVPTVALNDGAFPELITEGSNGWLVESSVEAANVIAEMCAHDIEMAGLKSRIEFDSHFTSRICTEKTLAAINLSIH